MRGVPRWFAVLAVFAMAAVVCAFTVHRALRPATFLLQLSEPDLSADGFSSTELKIRSSNGREIRGMRVTADDPHGAVVDSVSAEERSAIVSLRAGVLPGETKFHVTAPGFVPQDVAVETRLDASDSIGDGTPDFLRLHEAGDRMAFRRWFTLLAESQYYRRNTAASEIGDCAALLRFAYRETLRQHDALWMRAMALPVAPVSGVRQYQYPHTPIAAALFRVRAGEFQESDLGDGTFAQFADVETLWRYNTHFVGRGLDRARPGDLIFFRHDGGKMPFHAMIFLGPSQVESGSERFVVYHTGPSANSPGKIRRLSVAAVMNYPDARWRPIPSNPGFLGVYRWNILRGAE